MNTKYFLLSLLLALLLLPFLNYAQQEERSLQPQLTRDKSLFPIQSTGIWTEVHPLIPRVGYWGVDFVNADTGWAVGEGGAVIKTTNGGQKWIWYESGVENTLRTVAEVNNGQRVIAAGDGGIIIISEDGGESWNTLPSGTTDNIWNMQMITVQIGWMVGEGGTALKTTNGGLNWIQQPMPYPTAPYWDISFLDTLFGYVCSSSGIVLKTTNGGGSWQIQQAGDIRSLYTICAFDTLRASAGGFAGKVVYTTDGGINWLTAGGGISAAEINKIKFMDDAKGFLASSGGFYKSTNAGESWISIPDLIISGSSPTTTNLSLPTTSEGYVTGYKMLIAKTNDIGESWKRTIVNSEFINVYFKNEQEGFINSSNLIYKTYDSGQTLDTLLTFPYHEIYSVEGMLFTDSLNGFIGTLPTRIYKTTNSGESWYRSNIIGLTDTAGVIKKFFSFTSDIGWAIKGNQIMKTTDSGESWFVQQNIPGTLTSIHFVDSSYGWVTVLNRRPYKTTDGGENWIEQTNLNFYGTRDVYFANVDTGWMTADNFGYALYRTTDSGINWEVVTGVYDPRSFSFFPADSYRWWVYGFTNLYETANKGENWNDITPPLPLFSKFYAPYNWFGYGVGGIGYIINYFDSTYVPVELISFNAELVSSGVELIWVTATELNNHGFEVQKSYDMQTWVSINFVEGRGSTTEYIEYSFIDAEIVGDEVFYRLKQVDFDGSFEYSRTIEVSLENFPIICDLHQNYPNPFNATTVIKYSLPEKSFVNISLYNINGEKVSELVNEQKEKGIYNIRFNRDNLATGVFLYRMVTSSGYNFSRKLILLK